MAALIGTEIETYLWLVILLFVIGLALAASGSHIAAPRQSRDCVGNTADYLVPSSLVGRG